MSHMDSMFFNRILDGGSGSIGIDVLHFIGDKIFWFVITYLFI